MKEKVLKLIAEGKSIKEVSLILGIAYATAYYHSSEKEKRKTFERNSKNRKAVRERLKIKFGGRCSICGYSKCIAALEFHHSDSNKEGNVMRMVCDSWSKGYVEALKCQLVCANCHKEIHNSH